MARNLGPLRRLWYSWKMMRLPWRRKWLVGFDLEGNTFWEFKDSLHAGRARRILKPRRWTHHGDVQVPPQWSQWLRHTRFEPPTVAELQTDVARQQRMKVLAAQADARWASKPSFLDAPDKQQPAQMLESSHSGAGPRQANAVEEAGRREGEPQSILKSEEEIAGDAAEEKANESTLKVPKKMKKNRGPKDSPWNEVVKGNPGDEWQPNEWRPSPGRRRS